MVGTSRPKKWGEYGDWLSPFFRRLYKLPWVTSWKSHLGHGSNIREKVSAYPIRLMRPFVWMPWKRRSTLMVNLIS